MLIIDIDWNFLYLVLCRVAPLWDSVGMDIPKLSFRASIQIKQCMLSCTDPSEFIIALILDPISYQEQRLFRQRWRTWHVCWNIGMVQAWRVRGVLRVLLEEEKEHARKACCWHWHLPLMYLLHTNLIWLSIDTADNCLPLTIYQSLPCPGSTEKLETAESFLLTQTVSHGGLCWMWFPRPCQSWPLTTFLVAGEGQTK